MPLIGIFGVSFLTPLDALFALAAAIPLAALLQMERRGRDVRTILGVPGPGRRALAPVVIALGLLPVLVSVAAAQPVVVRRQLVPERRNAQAFFVFDTSRSMLASSGPGRPNRLERAKLIARRLEETLTDVPIGIASMTDRTVPELMPTADSSLFERTLTESVGINEPPPALSYGTGRSTNLRALVPLATSHFFSPGVTHRLLVVFTDGEIEPLTQLLETSSHHRLSPIFVHVWAPGEQVFNGSGQPDPNYTADPNSTALLRAAASDTGGSAFSEHQPGLIDAEARRIVGHGATRADLSAYARIALAPWFALAGVLPLTFLLWRRNA